MKFTDVVSVVQTAVAQAMGSEYMEKVGDLASLDSYKLVELGKNVLDTGTVDTYTKSLLSQLGKMFIDSRKYEGEMPSIFIDSFEWGGYIERVGFDLAEIIADPKWNLINNTDYSSHEHKFYQPSVRAKIFEEAKAIMTPISIVDDQLKESFNSWEQMNSFLSGVRTTVENTIRMGLLSMAHMLVQCAIAVSDKATHTAVHLRSEAVERGITGVSSSDTVSQLFNNPDFLVFTAQRIAETMDNAKVYSESFNDGSRPTFTDSDYAKLMVNNGFIRALQFNVESKFFNPEKLSFGKFDSVTSWQGIKNGSEKFTPELTTKVSITGDTNNKLGIGTGEYTSNCIALFYDRYALGICPYKRKVTSQYTASADFWTEFHHTLVNMIIDSSFNLVAFLVD